MTIEHLLYKASQMEGRAAQDVGTCYWIVHKLCKPDQNLQTTTRKCRMAKQRQMQILKPKGNRKASEWMWTSRITAKAKIKQPVSTDCSSLLSVDYPTITAKLTHPLTAFNHVSPSRAPSSRPPSLEVWEFRDACWLPFSSVLNSLNQKDFFKDLKFNNQDWKGLNK